MIVAQSDAELLPWLLGIQTGRPNPAGDFLRHLAEAALRADASNYELLRGVLLIIRAKYPDYHDPVELDYSPETFNLQEENDGR